MAVKAVVWYAPTWSTTPKIWWELKKSILSKGPMTRIVVGSLIAISITILIFKLAVPGFQIPNLVPALIALPAIIGLLSLQMLLLTQTKARVKVNSRKIIISHGSTAKIIESDSLTDVSLCIHENDRARLRFQYFKKDKRKLAVVGISDELDLIELELLLPMKIAIKDYCRKQSANTR